MEKTSHPYLSGNFAPIQTTRALTPCDHEGTIPADLAGGQYVRNGANPLANDDLAREAHWFDGDGMLSGVLFRRRTKGDGRDNGTDDNSIRPEFVNQYLLTDVYCYTKSSPWLRRPVIPSIATLVNPLSTIFTVVMAVVRTVLLAALSRSPGRATIKRISVANTSVTYHDGRALATCESGPPMRFALPTLETIGWFNGRKAEREPIDDSRSGFGGDGLLSFMKEWTTGHPKVDVRTGELIAFHSTLSKPFVRYSVAGPVKDGEQGQPSFDEPVPGVRAPTLMHDFGVSSGHTIIMDLPLSLDIANKFKGAPSLHYDAAQTARFGVFPRHAPNQVIWFETSPCLIFHTTNCWDVPAPVTKTRCAGTNVNLLACRATSPSVVYGSGNIPMPTFRPVPPGSTEAEHCRLYYYSFFTPSDTPLHRATGGTRPSIEHQWALSAIPFEFSSVAASRAMHEAQYVYGCSTSESFGAVLGKATKIDFLAKLDVRRLIAQGEAKSPVSITGCVDEREIDEVICDNESDPDDPVRLFCMPPGWYAQEPRFVPRQNAQSEDDGYLLAYVFDESTQLDTRGECRPDAHSELWIIDALGMKDVVAKIRLPQRVPYGLHGNWYTEEEIRKQRPYDSVRELQTMPKGNGVLAAVTDAIERWLG